MKKIQLALLAASASVALLAGCATQPTASNESKSACGSSARTPASTSEEYEGFNIQADQGYDGVAEGNFTPPPPPPEQPCDYLKRMGSVGSSDSCKNVARPNDITAAYSLDKSGNFYRWVSNGNKFLKCQITNNVENFKLSSHTRDAALLYYGKRVGGKLEIKYFQDQTSAGRQVVTNGCPTPAVKVDAATLEADGKDYGVTPSVIGTTYIVNVTLSKGGKFQGWPYARKAADGTVYQNYIENGVDEYAYNACYGKKGKPFSSYQLFLRKFSGKVVKLKGSTSGTFTADKETTETYSSINEFRTKQRITQAECDRP